MPKITVVGIEELEEVLKDNVAMDDVKAIVKRNGKEMMQKINKNADFEKGYQTGTTKRSVTAAGVNITDGGLTAEAGATTEYSEYVELGTRFMEAQPFVKPAFDEQSKRFKRDMQKLVK